MLTFHTARLRLPELTPDLMRARLNLAPDASGFTHTLHLDGHDHLIGVPATWPGDALPLLAAPARRRWTQRASSYHRLPIETAETASTQG